MVFSRFAFQIIMRLSLLFLNITLLAWLMIKTSFFAVTTIVGLVAVAQAWSIVRFVNRTNQELARFLNSVRYEDFLQSFSIEHLGSSFADLNDAFDEVMLRFRDTRSARETQARYLKTLVEHVPVAILSIHGDGSVEFLNNAARRLLNATVRCDLAALDMYGPVFQQDMAQSKAGEKKLTRTEVDGVTRQLVMSTTQITIGGDEQRLVSLQDIQTELDATELSAWQDMVRVLSHEIMNSITPIASLARTADELVDGLGHSPASAGKKAGKEASNPDDELIGDIHDAIRTVARRSEGLMHFVKSYRQLTSMPPPRLERIGLQDYVDRLYKLMTAEWKGRGIALHVVPPSEGLVLMADESLLDQAIINLLRNAADAVAGSEQPQVWFGARLNAGGQPVIEIADNGPGVDPEKRDKIFLPFFTTKAEGSGVGLSLARQVMLMHHGSISLTDREGGGAVFRLIF